MTCENCAAALAALTAERDEARETIRRLNRRCQEAEAAVAEKVQAHPHASLGRALANAAASAAEAELDRLRLEFSRERADALDWLESFWAQFASEVRGRPGVRHDGGLSLLSDTQEALMVGGRLVSAGVEGKDWWVLAPPSVHPASEPANATERPGDEALAKSASASSSSSDLLENDPRDED